MWCGCLLLAFCCLQTSRIAAKRDTPKEVHNETAIADRQARLPCDLSPSSPDDSVYLALWYKDDFATPIYSLDARHGGLGAAKHVAGDALAPRSYFNTVPRPALLLLERVTVLDAGLYRCRVDFRIAKTRNSVVRLQVIVPPTEVSIKDQFGETARGTVGPYTEGQRLLLVCESRGGQPPASVSWWRGTELLDDTYEVGEGGATRNQLQILALQRHHAGMRLVCQAANSLLVPPIAASVTLNVYLRPKTVSLLDSGRLVRANQGVQFVCRTVGSLPAANITWWLESSRIPSSQQEVIEEGNVTTSVLSLVPTVKDDNKELACVAENALVPGSAIEDVLRLKVQYAPQVTLKLGSNLRYSTIQEGHDVYFECHIQANPWVTEVAWHFEGRELQTNTTAGIIVTNQTLVLQRVRKDGRGRYTCSGLNELGRGESNPLYLRVQYSPICKENQKVLYGVTKHKPTKVSCQVEADPSEVSFRWTFNNSREDIDLINYANEGALSVASYVARTDLDYGTLMCWGINKVGMQREPCVFFVVPAGVPDSPQNCSVSNQTGHSFHVACQAGESNGLLQTYFLQVSDDDLGRTVANQSSETPHFYVKDLPAGRTFTLVVFSANELGRSGAVIIAGVTLATTDRLTHRGEAKWQHRLSSTVVILICLLVGLLLLAGAVLVAFRLRRNQTKGTASPAIKVAIRSCDVNGTSDTMDMAAIFENHKSKDWTSPGKTSAVSNTPLLEDGQCPPQVQSPTWTEEPDGGPEAFRQTQL